MSSIAEERRVLYCGKVTFAVQQAVPQTVLLSTSLQKASPLPPAEHPHSIAGLHHAGPWGLLAWAAAVAGEKGCWVALLSLQREIKWLPENVRGEGGYQKETHQSILSTALVLSAILGTWRVSQPHPQEYCLWRLVNSVFLTGLGFFCMDKSGSRPPSYLFVYAKHVLCHFTGHNQLHVQMQAWKTGGSPSSKLTITIILLSIKD